QLLEAVRVQRPIFEQHRTASAYGDRWNVVPIARMGLDRPEIEGTECPRLRERRGEEAAVTARPTIGTGRDAPHPEIRPPGMIGRDQESAALAAALTRPPAVVLVEGEAGVGKSRLVREFLAGSAGRPRALPVACPPFREPFTLG